jgi:hypothetical protein
MKKLVTGRFLAQNKVQACPFKKSSFVIYYIGLLNNSVGERFVERVAALQEQLVHQEGDCVHGEGSRKRTTFAIVFCRILRSSAKE